MNLSLLKAFPTIGQTDKQYPCELTCHMQPL